MGLTRERPDETSRPADADFVFALAGSPNVGKSTVFNALTGLRRHTGNWTGKTVSLAYGEAKAGDKTVALVDLPGCYSLEYQSPEEKVSRDFLASGEADGVIVVCDALALERNLILTLQILELCPRVVLCVNLMDEAEKAGVHPDCDALANILGIPVIPCAARSGKGVDELIPTVTDVIGTIPAPDLRCHAPYGEFATTSAKEIAVSDDLSPFDALAAIGDTDSAASATVSRIRQSLTGQGMTPADFAEHIRSVRVAEASRIANAVCPTKPQKSRTAEIADRILTGKYTAAPAMCIMLFVIFWLTAWGANYPSEALTELSVRLESLLRTWLTASPIPPVVISALLDGVYRVSAWVFCVMLPPMAIFFPIFTLLEDLGLFPRIAFNLDRAYRACGSCGKHALTSAMGFGCNAVGVCGCRIIDSPRERNIAILTNSIIPCNGRIGGIFLIIAAFFSSTALGQSAAFFAVFAFAVAMTFAVSAVLSRTLYRGEPSTFALEIVSYRRPQIVKTVVRSVLDRTVFVLGRALAVAAPAGLVIWLLTNVTADGIPLITHLSDLLDPAGRILGMDGVILTAFILGLPANEIVLPLCAMMYTQAASLSHTASVAEVLASSGWTSSTAVCVLIFTILHSPCSTTLLTVRRETGSTKMMLLSAAIPTAAGIVLCVTVAALSRIFA